MELEFIKMKEESARRIEKLIEGVKQVVVACRCHDATSVKRKIQRIEGEDGVVDEKKSALMRLCNGIVQFVSSPKEGLKVDRDEVVTLGYRLKLFFLEVMMHELGVEHYTGNRVFIEVLKQQMKNNVSFSAGMMQRVNSDFNRICELLTCGLQHTIQHFKEGYDTRRTEHYKPLNFYSKRAIQEFSSYRRRMTDAMIVVKETIHLLHSYL